MVRTLAVWVVATLLFWAGTEVMAIEEPKYEVVQRFPGFELRRYAAYAVAETEVDGPFDQAGNRAFRILAGYIFGANRSRTTIEMTAPVGQRTAGVPGERIEMTAPVAQRAGSGADGDRYILSFVMPARFTLETLPVPSDPRVRLRAEPSKLVAVRRYSGGWSQARYAEQEARLFEDIRAAGLAPIASPVYARYNSPFSLWFLRRNEVMVEIAEPASNP